jgi:hypothetical protein
MQQGSCIWSIFLPHASVVIAHFGEGQLVENCSDGEFCLISYLCPIDRVEKSNVPSAFDGSLPQQFVGWRHWDLR